MKRNSFRKAAAVACVFGGASIVAPAVAQSTAVMTYYISPSGTNTNGKTEATAFNSINTVMSILKPGDAVLVMNGTYTEEEPALR